MIYNVRCTLSQYLGNTSLCLATRRLQNQKAESRLCELSALADSESHGVPEVGTPAPSRRYLCAVRVLPQFPWLWRTVSGSRPEGRRQRPPWCAAVGIRAQEPRILGPRITSLRHGFILIILSSKEPIDIQTDQELARINFNLLSSKHSSDSSRLRTTVRSA